MNKQIIILPMRAKYEGPQATVVNTCNNTAGMWQNDLSPFALGPCKLYGDLIAQNMENAWQYSKLYAQHADSDGNPTLKYWQWAQRGWDNLKAVRYPMGRGARPLHAWWEGKKLGYVDARIQIYTPLYIKAVTQTEGFQTLKKMYDHSDILVLRDWDGYDHDKVGLSLTQVLNNPKRKMGHAFILKMLLTNDGALKQIAL